MNGHPLGFIPQVLELTEIGQNTMVVGAYDVPQVSRALYWHGKRNKKKFSYLKTPNGYLITLVGFRDKDDELNKINGCAPKGATHRYQGKYLKNIRTFKSKSEASEYEYAYDFWDGVKWRWVACKREDFLKIKPL